MRKVERDVYLQILDNLWMQHLENMDHLREGIHWMSVGQQDPLVEYRRQGQLLFDDMQSTLRHDIVRALFHAEPVDMNNLTSQPKQILHVRHVNPSITWIVSTSRRKSSTRKISSRQKTNNKLKSKLNKNVRKPVKPNANVKRKLVSASRK